ncbi:hypothetical protein LJC51_07430 [Lachnospiraceae bacterium OttesenSCG-928-J05]|nr:hypothetical protein [Lachnospiraceae bacterium OttesenSCG-928-J05]
MKYKLDSKSKKIVKAIMARDEERQQRQQSGVATDFDNTVKAAIAYATKHITLEGVTPSARTHIIAKLYKSLADGTPWEHLGDTYCCRRLFYQYRTEYCYLVASHMGIIRE